MQEKEQSSSYGNSEGSSQSQSGGGSALDATAWTGAPTTLNPQQNVNMSQTTNGTMIFAYQNSSTQSNAGRLSVSSGGTGQLLDVPALTNQPLLLINNWGGNNLSVSNISTTAATPIWIAAAGPGLPGQSCTSLPMTGKFVALSIFECAQGNAPAQGVVVTLQANSGQLTIFAIVVQSTAYVIALNAAQTAGPGTSNPSGQPPTGYFATTTTNNYQNLWNWGASTVYIINLSPGTAVGGQVSTLPG